MDTTAPFQMERLGIVMKPDPENPREAWGVLNPGGVRGPDGDYYLFPRIVAEGNFSRIGRARVVFDAQGNPAAVERLGYALEPREGYEVTRMGGGVEDPRVTYLRPLRLYVMTYTAYTPHHPRIALAVSHNLSEWKRLGPVHFATGPGEYDLNRAGNKDGVVFPDIVHDPKGRPCMALLHRPTYSIRHDSHGSGEVVMPPSGAEHLENIWISFAPLEHAHADIRQLTHLHEHQILMAPRAGWEELKVGAGAPPVRLPYGWLLIYHGVCGTVTATERHVRYCAGAAVLDLEDPTKTLYRSPQPILEPLLPQETEGVVPSVVFPTATDQREESRLDVYYGAADTVTAAARLTLPESLPAQD